MYKEKMAVALKHSGKVLRDFGDTVYLPFGSEYSIFIKNMNSVRALVNITIDGQDVGDGHSFIVNANDSIDVERFIKNDNLKHGNRFKFIERTENIENHRGIGIEDGLIRVEFKYERRLSFGVWNGIYGDGNWNTPTPLYKNELIGGVSTSNNISNVSYTSSIAATNVTPSAVSDAGITVPGSISDQAFTATSGFVTENESHVIVLKILGQTETNQQVILPVTVKTKPRCTTCGRVNKATAKFCTECGTSLTLV